MADVKILLLQFRKDAFIRQREVGNYVKFMKIQPEQLRVLNVFEDEIDKLVINEYDGIILGGAGRSYVSDNAEWQESVYELIRYALEIDKPILGICFGAQLSAEALGGRVERLDEMSEYGTYSVYLTSDAREDALFKSMPEEFFAQMGHKDSVTKLPEGAIRLAFSDRVGNQAYCMPNRKFYMVQFHPELDEESLRERFLYYQGEYANSKEEYHEILSNISESEEAPRLLEHFVNNIVSS